MDLGHSKEQKCGVSFKNNSGKVHKEPKGCVFIQLEKLLHRGLSFRHCSPSNCGNPLSWAFVDFERVFNTVEYKELVENLQKSGVDGADLGVFRKL